MNVTMLSTACGLFQTLSCRSNSGNLPIGHILHIVPLIQQTHFSFSVTYACHASTFTGTDPDSFQSGFLT